MFQASNKWIKFSLSNMGKQNNWKIHILRKWKLKGQLWQFRKEKPNGCNNFQAVVTMSNNQMYRHIMSPGWTLGWTWAKKEVIWSIVGAQADDQGDCSKFKGNIPHSCERNPTIIDLLPGVPFNQQFSSCCKGGVLTSWIQDPAAAVSAFQLSVGLSGTSNKTVRLPKNFTLLGPGRGYTCSPATIVQPSIFFSYDGRRKSRALSKFSFLLVNNDIFY